MSLENTLREMMNEKADIIRPMTTQEVTKSTGGIPPNPKKKLPMVQVSPKGKITPMTKVETLKEHFKQRLQEELLGLNEAIPLDVLRARVGRDPNAGARTRQRAAAADAAAAAAAGSKPKGKPKDKPKDKPVEGASPATTPAPQIDLNALRDSRQSG